MEMRDSPKSSVPSKPTDTAPISRADNMELYHHYDHNHMSVDDENDQSGNSSDDNDANEQKEGRRHWILERLQGEGLLQVPCGCAPVFRLGGCGTMEMAH